LNPVPKSRSDNKKTGCLELVAVRFGSFAAEADAVATIDSATAANIALLMITALLQNFAFVRRQNI
jgi:hypothetical protein